MKNTILLSLCFFPLLLFAQERNELSSKINEVTVYQSGARVSRIAETTVEKGTQVFFLTGISSKMDKNSIQVKVEGGINIISVSQELDYFDPSILEEEKIVIVEQIQSLRDSLELISVRSEVYAEEKDLILKNKDIAGQDQLKAEDLESMAIFYRERLLEIEEQLFRYKLQQKSLQRQIDILNKQIREQNAIPQSSSAVVRIALSSEQKMAKSTIRLMYNISDAAWVPEYDARIESTEEALSLAYNAKVYQNTGEDWSDVRLSLSTGDPSRSNDMPDIQPYRLYGDMSYSRSLPVQAKPEYKSNHIARGQVNKTAAGYLIEGFVFDRNGESLIGVSLHLEGTSIGAVTDIDGQFSLLVPLDFYGDMVVSYIGFQSVSVSPREYSYHEFILDEEVAALSEILVVGYAKKKRLNIRGSRSNDGAFYEDGIEISESRSTVDRQLSNTVFEVEDKYNIPSDNKPYDVQLLSYDIPASYSYYAVPKLSSDAYLLANITNWEDYELLDGKLSIYYKGVFQGYSSIDVQELGDTLSFSVGKDPDIVLERKLDKTFNSKSLLGANVKEQKAWNISIRNTKSTAIRLVLEDQVPVSSVDNIKVDIIEMSNADLEENSGKLSWKLDLPPDSNRRLSLKYEVRYPKKMTVIIQ